MNIICGQCKALGKKSTVRMVKQFKTKEKIDVWWDTDGSKHVHNPNWVHEFFECSAGHGFDTYNLSPPCPNPMCGWSMEKPPGYGQ